VLVEEPPGVVLGAELLGLDAPDWSVLRFTEVVRE
jgi:hypothetical protein